MTCRIRTTAEILRSDVDRRVTYTCASCRKSWLAVGSKDEQALLEALATPACPKFGCEGQLRREKKNDADAEYVRAGAFYEALNSLGLPEERLCGPEDLGSLLVGKRIESIHLEPSPSPHRSIVHSITLEGGLTLHLSTSGHGATAYRMTRS